MVRRLLVLVVALLLGVQVVRNAGVAAYAEIYPHRASIIWAGHPSSEIALAMTEIGRAARDKQPVGQSIFDRIDDAAAKAPLAPEPFLVRGVQSSLAGNSANAADAFLAAERRDPRSLPARYFLADVFYRRGDTHGTLDQIATLARLAPNGTTTMGPYIAAYAANRSEWPELRNLFRDNAALEDTSLTALAHNPDNAQAIVALANPSHLAAKPQPQWVPTLVNSLVRANRYAQARAVWTWTSHVHFPPGALVYDAGFTDTKTPAPFNWDLTSSNVGLAEREAGGHLHVIYYGQDNGVLARQLLILPAGTYNLSMKVSGNLAQPRSLIWSVRCDGSGDAFATTPLGAVTQGWSFTVPASCPAQWLELVGTGGDVAQQSDVSISNLKLERGNG